jgi:hypothetical protein
MYREKSFKYARKKSKYKNVFQDQGGVTYHSKFEAKVARDLELRRLAGELVEVKRQVKVMLYGENGSHVCDYWCDFWVQHADGQIQWIECKGFATREWAIKWKLFEDKMRGSGELLTVMKP